MMTISRMLCALVVAAAAAGCASDGGRTQVGGALGGAVVGGLLGSEIGSSKEQLAATAAGTLLGGYLGTEVGRSLDRADRLPAEETAQISLGTSPDGQTSHWSNPGTGHAGTFTPTNAYRSDDDLLCRDYDQSATADGKTQDAFGTACWTDDGTWRVVETPVRPGVLRRSTARRRR